MDFTRKLLVLHGIFVNMLILNNISVALWSWLEYLSDICSSSWSTSTLLTTAVLPSLILLRLCEKIFFDLFDIHQFRGRGGVAHVFFYPLFSELPKSQYKTKYLYFWLQTISPGTRESYTSVLSGDVIKCFNQESMPRSYFQLQIQV